MSFDLKGALVTFAPTLAGMLGGPFAGMAVTALEGAFGLAPGAGVDGITKVIQSGQMTPEIMAAVRAQDQKHAEIMGQQGIDVMKVNGDFEAASSKLVVDDRMSARKSSVDGGTSKMLFWLSLVLLAVTLGTEVAVLFNGYPKGLSEIIVGRVLGQMDAVTLMVLAFWYGTTNTSARKTELNHQLQVQTQTQTPPVDS